MTLSHHGLVLGTPRIASRPRLARADREVIDVCQRVLPRSRAFLSTQGTHHTSSNVADKRWLRHPHPLLLLLAMIRHHHLLVSGLVAARGRGRGRRVQEVSFQPQRQDDGNVDQRGQSCSLRGLPQAARRPELLKHLTYLNWLTHIHDIADDAEKVEWTQDFRQHVQDHEGVNDKTIHFVGRRMKLAWFMFYHRIDNDLSLKSLATISVDVILDDFLLGRFFRILQGEKKYTREELPALSSSIVKEDGIPANGWRYQEGALQYDVFHSKDWLQLDMRRVLEPQWWPAVELAEDDHWTNLCEEQEATIRALTISSIGTEEKKVGGESKFEVVFSNKERVWMSDDDIEAADVEQWAERWKASEPEEDEQRHTTRNRNKAAIPKKQGDSSLQAQIAELEQQLKEERQWRAAKLRAERNQKRRQEEKWLEQQLRRTQDQLHSLRERAIPFIEQVRDEALRRRLLELIPGAAPEESEEADAPADDGGGAVQEETKENSAPADTEQAQGSSAEDAESDMEADEEKAPPQSSNSGAHRKR